MTTPLIIVLLVVGSLVGSILWVLPSPAERRRMKLREAAYSRGYRVKQYTLNDLHSSFPKGEDRVTYYYFRLAKYPAFSERQVFVNDQGQWGAVGDGGPDVAQVLAGLTALEGCRAVLFGGSEIGFLWEESGLPDTVVNIIEALSWVADDMAA